MMHSLAPLLFVLPLFLLTVVYFSSSSIHPPVSVLIVFVGLYPCACGTLNLGVAAVESIWQHVVSAHPVDVNRTLQGALSVQRVNVCILVYWMLFAIL